VSVIEASDLSKRFRQAWAVRDCDLSIPAGRVVALVGPNGAGKTTLLHMLVGLVRPTSGTVSVLGGLQAGSADALDRIAFVAKDGPLYPSLSVGRMLELAASMNWRFDMELSYCRLAHLGIPVRRKVGKLSGGQQEQLALTIAFARRPDLLILDEPCGRLDPLARFEFLASLLTTVADDGLSVVFSSHIVSELERVADYLVVLADGRARLAGDIGDLLAGHVMMAGPVADADHLARRYPVVHGQRAGRQAQLLVRARDGNGLMPRGWEVSPVTLQELVLGYLRESAPVPPAGAALADAAITGRRPA
jgi:ABC-2 type transport system ATP-binding protein